MPPAPDPLDRTSQRGQVDEERIGRRDLRVWRTREGQFLVRLFSWLVSQGQAIFRRWSLPITLALTFLIGGGLTAWAGEAATDVYEEVRDRSGVAQLDQPVLDWVVTQRTPASDAWITDFTDIGGKVGGVVLTVVVVLALVAFWRRWTPVVVIVPAMLGALLITVVGKDLTARARPPEALAVPPYEVSASFPSGHTLNATVLAGLAAYLLLILSKRLWLGALGAALALTYALAMGVSRIWLGHHWLTDVLAGWLLGFAIVFAVIMLHRLWLTLRPATSRHDDRAQRAH